MKHPKLTQLLAAAVASVLLLGGLSAQAAERTVKVAIGSTSFAWFPLYVAYGAGYFKDEGLNVEIVNVPANSTPAAAMMNGSVDIAGLGTQTAFAAIDKGLPIKILTPMVTEYTSTIFGRKDVLKAKGVSRQSPLADRVKAMFGLKLATTAIGAGPHLMYRYLFKTYANGADADKVAQIVPIGNSSETLAGMKRGIVDISAFSPPVPEKAVADGYGEVLIDFMAGDVPAVQGSVYVVLTVSDDKLKNDAPMVAAFVRAINRADQLSKTDLTKAGEAAKVMLKNMDSDLYNRAVKSMTPALPATALVPVDGLGKMMHLLTETGYKYQHIDVKNITANDFVAKAIAEKK